MNKLIEFFFRYIQHIISVILVFLTIRVFEYFFLISSGRDNISFYLLFNYSMNFDVFLVLSYSYVFLPLFLVLSYLNEKAAGYFIKAISFLFILFNLVLTHYFITTNSLLTNELFYISLKDISSTVLAELSINKLILWLFNIFIIILTILLFRFFTIKSLKTVKIVAISLYVIGIIIIVINIRHASKSIKYFDDQYLYFYSNSKITMLIDGVISHNREQNELDETGVKDYTENIRNWQKSNNKSYISTNYPFVHTNDYSNVLGKYFNKQNHKPNIVIILSESLSSSFCGNNAVYMNLMPFTQSLIRKSLYWENFLSNAERSYGALPSVLGSLPYGNSERGFLNMQNTYAQHRRYPLHFGLLQWLRENSYYTYFFYGGWGYFDNMGFYLNETGIDYLVDQSGFDTTKYHKHSPITNDKFLWGYNDKQLFARSFDILNMKDSFPYFSLYFTLTLHTPFNLVDTEYTRTDYINRRLQEQKVDPGLKKKLGKDLLASILFVDDALKSFFSSYEKRPDYNETIFIILGDHGYSIDNNNVFDGYSIPLIIWSPLLTGAATFRGVSSQLDILPTLYALLSDNFGLSKLSNSNWLGSTLDTSTTFRSSSIFHLSLLRNTLPNFIYRNYVVYNNLVFSFTDLRKKKLVTNYDSTALILKLVKDYKIINSKTCKYDKINWEHPVGWRRGK
jgi:phosphoglycerol transferase MdoB-like AlkP superfamily enzyme